MKIGTIVDKLIKEADVNTSEYTVPDRLEDIHQTRLELQELRAQYTADDSVHTLQTATVIAGDNTITRTVKHNFIVNVEFREDSDQDWYCLTKRGDCDGRKCIPIVGEAKYTFDYDQVYIWNAQAGEVRVTYSHTNITEWVEADYTDNTATPDELPEVYHKLLYMAQVLRHTGYYSKERYEQTSLEYEKLMALYIDHLTQLHDNDIIMR